MASRTYKLERNIRGGRRVAIDLTVSGDIDCMIPEGRGLRVNGEPVGSGEPGVGVPPGGTTGQVLTKDSTVDFDTVWSDPTTGDLTPDAVANQPGTFVFGVDPITKLLIAQPSLEVTDSPDGEFDGDYSIAGVYADRYLWSRQSGESNAYCYWKLGRWNFGHNYTTQLIEGGDTDWPWESEWTPSLTITTAMVLRSVTLDQLCNGINIALACFENSSLQILAGEADSGGEGYRVLRILNG